MIVGSYCYLTPSCPVILENVTVAWYREIPHIFWSSNIHDIIHKISLVPFLNSVTLVLFLLPCLFDINFNTMLLFTFTFSKCFISLNFSEQIFYKFYLALCLLMPCRSHLHLYAQPVSIECGKIIGNFHILTLNEMKLIYILF